VRRHAVFVGANDVGKSSIFRLLQHTMGSSLSQLYQDLSIQDLADPNSPLIVEATFVDFSDLERTIFSSEMSIAPTDQSESLLLILNVEQDVDDPDSVSIRRYFPDSGHDRGPTRDQLATIGWRLLNASRITSQNFLSGPQSALNALLSSIDLGAEKPTIAGILEEFNNALSVNPELQSFRISVSEGLSKSMPRSIGPDDLSVRSLTDPESDVLGNVSIFFVRDGQHVPISDQSDGVKQLMAITLYDLAERLANMIAIDEPELHLHPASQRTVADLLGSGTNQKLLATHSPYVVQRFEPAEVIAIDPSGHCHQIADTSIDAVEKLRAHWWSPQLLESLASRLTIVVEGAADRIILESVAHAMGVNLDQLGAVVFDIGGAAKFPSVYRLIGAPGFGVPIVGLVDEAEKASWHGAIGGRPNTVFGSTLWVPNPDLESEYCDAFGGPDAARALIAGGYCNERSVLQSCNVATIGDITTVDVANYCRKDKVLAASAISTGIDSAISQRMLNVCGLIEHVRVQMSS
jgi:putative ATP-dependent endonuclease of OLD family